MNVNNAEDFFQLPRQQRELADLIDIFVRSHEDMLLRSSFNSRSINLMAKTIHKVLEKGKQAYELYVRWEKNTKIFWSF